MWKIIKSIFKRLWKICKNIFTYNGDFKKDLDEVIQKFKELWKELKDLVKYTK